MKISLIAIGETYDTASQSLINEYSKRLDHYTNFDIVITSDEKLNKILEKYNRVFLLDEGGKEYTSREFADFIQKEQNIGSKSICFVVGGAYGFNKETESLATSKISLSKMTFTHQMVRAIFIEQLYRSFTIINNEKYHH